MDSRLVFLRPLGLRLKRSASQEAGNLKNQLFEFLFQESVLPANRLEYIGLKDGLPRIWLLARTKYGKIPGSRRLQGLGGTVTRVLISGHLGVRFKLVLLWKGVTPERVES